MKITENSEISFIIYLDKLHLPGFTSHHCCLVQNFFFSGKQMEPCLLSMPREGWSLYSMYSKYSTSYAAIRVTWDRH